MLVLVEAGEDERLLAADRIVAADELGGIGDQLEVIGTVDAVGSQVSGWTGGERVGIGWHGGSCGYCGNCRRGDTFACETETLATGVTSDGGYADFMIAPAEALARVPDELSSVDAAPLMCAGITTFNALRNSGAIPVR